MVYHFISFFILSVKKDALVHTCFFSVKKWVKAFFDIYPVYFIMAVKRGEGGGGQLIHTKIIYRRPLKDIKTNKLKKHL